MLAGVIDIGSNSVKLLIADSDGEQVNVLESLKTVIPLGIHTFFRDRISQEITTQLIEVLGKYQQVIKEYGVTTVKVIATTAVREASNRDIFLDTVLRKTGLDIEVLTVGDIIYYIDSYLSYKLKDSYPVHEKNVLIAELGAGSLDISLMQKGFTRLNVGLPIGTLRLKQLLNRLDGSASENQEALREFIESQIHHLRRTIPRVTIDDVILIDENYLSYLPMLLPGTSSDSAFFKLSNTDAANLSAQLADMTPDEIADTYKVPPEIIDTFSGYATILNALFLLIKSEHIYILETSLAEAVLANILLELELSKKYNKTNQLVSVATFLCDQYNLDLEHSKQVAFIAEALFKDLRKHLGLEMGDLLYLLLAAYLHDIGTFIHNRAHHKHSEYIINSLNLFRLTEEEVRLIACIARYHRRAFPMASHLLYSSLPRERQILVMKLSALLRIANALDRSHRQKIKKVEAAVEEPQQVMLSVTAGGSLLLERTDFLAKKDLFEEITGSKLTLRVKE